MKLESPLKNLYHQFNFLPEFVANKILSEFKKNKKWQKINQKKTKHYGHIFKNKSKFLPDINENYLANFYRSEELSSNKYILKTMKKYVVASLEKYFKFKANYVDLRCHKFMTDNFARTHFDNYAGDYAVTIYFNKNWKWDWGGILCIPYGKKYEKIFALGPIWNSINILTSKNRKESPHFITSVNPFAKQPRYSITLFVK